MNVRLRDADARAVDLLLDRAAMAQGDGPQGVLFAAGATSHAGVSNAQVAAVETVLKLLDAMPSSEPASDLLQRTMDRIDAHTAAPMRGQGPTLIDVTRPMA